MLKTGWKNKENTKENTKADIISGQGTSADVMSLIPRYSEEEYNMLAFYAEERRKRSLAEKNQPPPVSPG